MFIIQIIINNIEKITFQQDDQISVQEIINNIIREFKFPRQSTTLIEIDQVIRDPTYIVNFQPNSPIKANFSYETTITFIDKFNNSFEHRCDLCKSIFQIEQEIIKEILPLEYSLQILQPIDEQNINTLYINSYEKIPQQLEFTIQANFYINFYGFHHQFNINPFNLIELIKYEILEFYNIQQEFQLYYNETELNNHQQYITYFIPNHSELKIKLQTRIKLFIKYQNYVHQYSCSLDEKLEKFKQKLRQIYQIPEKYLLQLTYKNNLLKNDQESISQLKIEENSIIIMEIGNKHQLTLQDKYSSKYFQFQVRSIDLVSILDKQNPFINQQVTYFFQGQELIKTETFEQLKVDTENLTIYYKIEKLIINVYFQDENQRQKKMGVIISDQIKYALQQLNSAIDSITLSYQGKNISIESTYEKEGIINDSIIYYKINDKLEIRYTISPNFQEHFILVQNNITGAQLLKIIPQVYLNQGYKYKLMLNNCDFPLDQKVTQNQCFRLVRTFEIQFYSQDDNQYFLETFSQEDTILEAKQKFSQKFSLHLDSLIILYKDILLKDDQLIHQYKEKQLWISQIIGVTFQKRNGTASFSKRYQKQVSLKSVLNDFIKEQSPCRFEYNEQLIDENFGNKLLKDICQDQQQIILIYEFEQNLKLINKEKQTEVYKIKFYPKEIVGSVFNKLLDDKFQYYNMGQLIDTYKSFDDNKIKNNSQIYYNKIYQFTLDILNDKSNIKFQVNSLNHRIIDAISPIIQKKYSLDFTAYLNNRLINLEQSFKQENINNDATIQIQLLIYLTVTVHENELNKIFQVDPNANIGQLNKLLDNKQNKKLFSFTDQIQLEDHILLSTLKKNNNKVDLVYKEATSISNSVYQPSGLILDCISQTQNMKTTDNSTIEIIIQNMLNDEKLQETVRLDQKLGDFFHNFQLKMEFSDISLFYEGEIVDYEKTFEEIGAGSQSLFEII
ncbi:unnamed protein product [Paramecium pentaurelia]|uniref:Ubiquitin-like domain-containing protein n=1 Tax=Paramecium pentaurelia TaxID=43138 RepID=A0A8S1YC16_9CILI|nr:unnamed protein product [Paramecium pentaurelia]